MLCCAAEHVVQTLAASRAEQALEPLMGHQWLQKNKIEGQLATVLEQRQRQSRFDWQKPFSNKMPWQVVGARTRPRKLIFTAYSRITSFFNGCG